MQNAVDSEAAGLFRKLGGNGGLSEVSQTTGLHSREKYTMLNPTTEKSHVTSFLFSEKKFQLATFFLCVPKKEIDIANQHRIE